MNRRQFLMDLGFGAGALALWKMPVFSSPSLAAAAASPPQVAITMDDFSISDTPLLSGAARNQAILDALKKYKLKAAAFVAGKFVDDAAKLPLVGLWNDGGHMIANHSYSHWFYPRTDLNKFTEDILRNEKLLQEFKHYRKFFRFPYLKEGKTAEQRDQMRAFLKEHDYRNGHVTIDASDWYVDGRLRERLKTNPQADTTPYRDFYLNHLWERATYYDDLSRKVLGRSVKHTLLVHHNLLNGLFLGDVLGMFKRKGWKLIHAEDAFSDPIFQALPKNAPAGESLIWALAKETGKFEKLLRYPGEDGDYEKPRMDALAL